MIDEIHVENLALIKSVDFEPAPGLTVLTGETGAGKTALLNALKLLTGERADKSTVREGESSATVSGRIFQDARDTEGTVVVRRVSADGRSRAKIDGAPASVNELAERIGCSIDLCGQHEHQRLLDSATHVHMLDAWAGAPVLDALKTYRQALADAKTAREELLAIKRASATQGARIDESRSTLQMIDEVSPEEGEIEKLEELLPRAEHAETLVSTASDAYTALTGESGVLDALNSAIWELQSMERVDTKLGEFAKDLSNAAFVIEDAASDIRRYRDEVDFDPSELSRMQKRYSELSGLLRGFGPTMADVLKRRAEAAELLSLYDDRDERIRSAERKLQELESDLNQKAKTLYRARAKAAPRFCREVGKQMARLDMHGAELIMSEHDLERSQWSDIGSKSYEFLYRSAAGLTPRPLKRVASGGELSRVMLACKVVLGESDHVETLVFDEVDAGVGGSTARSLAAVLADLAQTHQVIVVTHLAQVAVAGQKHYVVSKTEADIPETRLIQVEGEDRVSEIARMLSGDSSAASLAHARELLS